ncbi:MAG: FMN-binding negative transcriptional regulator [Sulfobacillus thermosulfidooxidans]|uniref:FMN-binding negative transcriptional regulator n=1 Tax=Sulfobacillus thermosulfidooxidans TaxID=28034 RepID=A0A2T2WXD4_SULTH|nr:MAG: FMN-binding negative transcriptional regulator [Sulfobacillus thermosulfidooxidans]
MMYNPPEFQIASRERLIDMIKTYPLGQLISHQDGEIRISYIPFLYQPSQQGGEGFLIGHMARANSQWRGIDQKPVVVSFLGPHAYISPTYYQEEHSVPTWNYVAVQVHGICRIIQDSEEAAGIVAMLLDAFEPSQHALWSQNLRESPYRQMLSQIVGISIQIQKMEGKAKLGQNRSRTSRMNAIGALLAQRNCGDHTLAQLMRQALDEEEKGNSSH